MSTGDTHAPAGTSNDIPGLGFLLARAHRARRRSWEAQLADLGLTAPQAAVLRLLAARPGAGVRELGRTLDTDPMNVQRIVATLLGGRLCEVRRDPDDARRRPLHLTEAGRRLAEEVVLRAEDVEHRLIGLLGERDYVSLRTGLGRLLERDHGSPRAEP